MTTTTYTVHVPHVPDWVCELIAEVARATGTDPAAATRLALVEGLLYWQRAYGDGVRRAAFGDRDEDAEGGPASEQDHDADKQQGEGEGGEDEP